MSATVWVEVGDRPRVAFFLGRPPPADLMPPVYYPTLAELGKLRRPLGVNVETANLAIAWDNARGETGLLLDKLSPHVKVKRLLPSGASETLFDGVFQAPPEGDQRLSATVVGDALLEPLRLRKSTELDRFADLSALFRVFGQSVAFKPLAYNSDGTEWLCNDGRLSRIRAVFDGDSLLAPEAYVLSNRVDARGRPIAVLLLANAPETPELLTVVADGEPDPDETPVPGGAPAPIENPAGLARYLLRELVGLELPAGRLDRFRLAARARPLRGVVDDSYKTPQALLNDLARSAGARWSLQAPGLFVDWPPARGANDPIYATLDTLSGWDVVSRAAERITQLTVNYGYDWSVGDYTRAIVLRAPVVYEQLGEVSETLELRWVGQDAVAEAIGRKALAYQAARVYQVTWTTTQPDASQAGPGRWVRLDHPHSKLTGVWPLVECAVDPLTFETDMVAEGYIGSLAAVEVVLRSERQALISRTIQVKRVAGGALITILDPETNNPLAGAQVIVDNRVFITDASGEITIPGVRSGQTLTITVTPVGGEPFQVTQTV